MKKKAKVQYNGKSRITSETNQLLQTKFVLVPVRKKGLQFTFGEIRDGSFFTRGHLSCCN